MYWDDSHHIYFSFIANIVGANEDVVIKETSPKFDNDILFHVGDCSGVRTVYVMSQVCVCACVDGCGWVCVCVCMCVCVFI